MQSASEKITEAVSGMTYAINGVHAAENVPGAQGKALRFDGYSTYIDASVGNIIPAGSKKMTASVWLAVETYPIVEIDVKSAPPQPSWLTLTFSSAVYGHSYHLPRQDVRRSALSTFCAA